MVEELLVGGAEIVQTVLAVRGPDEPMLRALAVAGETHLALAAEFWQRLQFVVAEFPLGRRINHRAKALVHHIVQPVAWINVVVTTIDIPVVFDRKRQPASFREDTE